MDRVLVELLRWLRTWFLKVAEQDADHNCRLLSEGCSNLHEMLAGKAMQSLATLPCTSSGAAPDLLGSTTGGNLAAQLCFKLQ